MPDIRTPPPLDYAVPDGLRRRPLLAIFFMLLSIGLVFVSAALLFLAVGEAFWPDGGYLIAAGSAVTGILVMMMTVWSVRAAFRLLTGRPYSDDAV